jgi:hypothetical protein
LSAHREVDAAAAAWLVLQAARRAFDVRDLTDTVERSSRTSMRMRRIRRDGRAIASLTMLGSATVGRMLVHRSKVTARVAAAVDHSARLVTAIVRRRGQHGSALPQREDLEFLAARLEAAEDALASEKRAAAAIHLELAVAVAELEMLNREIQDDHASRRDERPRVPGLARAGAPPWAMVCKHCGELLRATEGPLFRHAGPSCGVSRKAM